MLKNILILISRWMLQFALFLIFFTIGGMLISDALPVGTSTEPGPIPSPFDLLLVGAAHTLVIGIAIQSSKLYGWRLMLVMAFVIYSTQTFIMQIETAYFLLGLTVSSDLLSKLFLMGLPVALIYVPLVVWIMGKSTAPAKVPADEVPRWSMMPAGQWIWKLTILTMTYVTLYLLAGYFIAWQNPELRAFYGGADPGQFSDQLNIILSEDPLLIPFQVLRALLWILFVLPIIRWSNQRSAWQIALIVGLLVALPQNIGHLLPNPLIPSNSVRLSHMLETASSTFVFGLLVVWLLHRQHYSLRDLFGIRTPPKQVSSMPGSL